MIGECFVHSMIYFKHLCSIQNLFSYGARNREGIPGASDNVLDFGDSRSSKGTYGSFQVHSYDKKSTIFAMNRFNDGRAVDIGIGNNPSGHPDWTFEGSSKFRSMKLQVFANVPANYAEMTPPPVYTLDPTSLPEFADYSLAYKLEVPDKPNFSESAVPYEVDNRYVCLSGLKGRVFTLLFNRTLPYQLLLTFFIRCDLSK